MNNFNNKNFDSQYSEVYDLIYEQKNYEDECRRIRKFFVFKDKIQDILELGCGTCGHTIIFSKSGYLIDAVDKSKKMLDVARKKIEIQNIKNVNLILSDIYKLNITKSYDVILLLFNVVGYLDNFKLFLNLLKKNLKEGSLLIFDFWNKSAVEKNGPKETIKFFEKNCLKIEKKSIGKIINEKNSIDIKIETSLIKEGTKISGSKERHLIRYYDLIELQNSLKSEGYELLKFEDFKIPEKKPDDVSWNVFCVSKFLG
tara:strand:+ start:1708 stop:2478 length:771 start_codon:yes stop_codon:yes gene_type:complete